MNKEKITVPQNNFFALVNSINNNLIDKMEGSYDSIAITIRPGRDGNGKQINQVLINGFTQER